MRIPRHEQPAPSPIWLAPMVPKEAPDGWIEPLAESLLAAGTVVNISSQPALWGSVLRSNNVPLMAVGAKDLSRAVSESHAAQLLEAHLIELLSCIGKNQIDYYFLNGSEALEEFQIHGALSAIESAIQDEVIRFVGLASFGSPYAALGLWQFHDAFDFVLYPSNPKRPEYHEVLGGLAGERGTQVVQVGSLRWHYDAMFYQESPEEDEVALVESALRFAQRQGSVLVGVQNPHQVECALAVAGQAFGPEDSRRLAPYLNSDGGGRK